MGREEGHVSIGLSRPVQRIGNAIKEMNHNWAETSPYWKDKARRAFQKAFMDELLLSAKAAMGSMAEIQRFLHQVIQDCS
jgi:hypothetical protein